MYIKMNCIAVWCLSYPKIVNETNVCDCMPDWPTDTLHVLHDLQIQDPENDQEKQKLDEIAQSMGIAEEREALKEEKNALLTKFWRLTGPAKVFSE